MSLIFFGFVCQGAAPVSLRIDIPKFPIELTGTGDLFAATLLAWTYCHPDDLKVRRRWWRIAKSSGKFNDYGWDVMVLEEMIFFMKSVSKIINFTKICIAVSCYAYTFFSGVGCTNFYVAVKFYFKFNFFSVNK